MKKDMITFVDVTDLRQRAEEKLKTAWVKDHPHISEPDVLKLVHELQVHQIELIMQNEELRQAKDDANTWLALYTELFDFAPVGYFTLDRQGVIHQVNLRGSSLIEEERSRLIKRRFGLFVSPETRPVFNTFLESVFESRTKQICEIVLLTKADVSINVQIEAVVPIDSEDCHIVLEDITERKRMEEDKRRFYHDTIKSVTQGKLELVSNGDLKEYLDSAEVVMHIIHPADSAIARHKITEFCRLQGIDDDRLGLFEVGVGEAITNAIKHAKEARVYVGVYDDFLWVAVSDHGQGISTLTLPGAMLCKGYSTKASMGMGFSLMMEASDNIKLCTNTEGTTVLLSIKITAPQREMSLDDLPDTWDTPILLIA